LVDFDLSFGQQFLDVTAGQVVAQVPPDRDHDHLSREPKPDERRPRRTPGEDTSTTSPSKSNESYRVGVMSDSVPGSRR